MKRTMIAAMAGALALAAGCGTPLASSRLSQVHLEACSNCTVTVTLSTEGGATVKPAATLTVPQDAVKAAVLDATVPGASKAPAISPEAAKGILDAIKTKAAKTQEVTP